MEHAIEAEAIHWTNVSPIAQAKTKYLMRYPLVEKAMKSREKGKDAVF